MHQPIERWTQSFPRAGARPPRANASLLSTKTLTTIERRRSHPDCQAAESARRCSSRRGSEQHRSWSAGRAGVPRKQQSASALVFDRSDALLEAKRGFAFPRKPGDAAPVQNAGRLACASSRRGEGPSAMKLGVELGARVDGAGRR